MVSIFRSLLNYENAINWQTGRVKGCFSCLKMKLDSLFTLQVFKLFVMQFTISIIQLGLHFSFVHFYPGTDFQGRPPFIRFPLVMKDDVAFAVSVYNARRIQKGLGQHNVILHIMTCVHSVHYTVYLHCMYTCTMCIVYSVHRQLGVYCVYVQCVCTVYIPHPCVQ